MTDNQQELDLIDIIRFFWRSRFFIGIGMLTGMAVSISVWAFKQKVEELPPPAPTHWTARLATNIIDNPTAVELSLEFNNFLKTSEGALAFYEAINKAAITPTLDTVEWSEKQKIGTGMIKSLDLIGPTAVVTIPTFEGWSESQIKIALPMGITGLVKALSQQYSQIESEINQEQLNLQYRMAANRMQGLQLFYRHSGFAPDMQKSIVEGLLKELATNVRPEPLVFLLSAISDSQHSPNELVSNYRKLYDIYQTLESRRKSIAKVYPIAKFVIGPVTEMTSNIPPPVETRSLIFSRLPIAIAMGIFLGVAVGTFIAIILAYWRENRSRLQDVLQSS